MSTGQRSTHLSHSSRSSKPSVGAPRQTPPPAALTPEHTDLEFEPCAATGSFLLYAQRNTILVLHHDTLAIERRFELHREDVKWISVDNVSERGSGRLAVSYDTGSTAIVWDIFTGAEVSRFSAYDSINVACFMRNGNIAFGNVQGSIILFEPSTHEHLSARTIFDPVTSLAPSADCRTFAIGYLNGSILVATIQPAFTIQHTLTTSRAPSRITGLAWHGSSSKSKTDMLAAQTQDGDLRVWSVPKAPYSEQPMIIRVLNRSDAPLRGPNWFAWSKSGRIVQYADGESRSWDVRTKKVTFDTIPTIEGVTGIANYGPTATLFTLGRRHTVQQYDINPTSSPMQVVNVQHVPANTPPTPPTNLAEHKNPYANSESESLDGVVPILAQLTDGESSADEGQAAMSPLEKIAREIDSLNAMESELRDKVMPLSPMSSSASSSSKSSGRAHRQRRYLYDRPESSRASTTSGYEETEFSFGVSAPRGHESMSIRSSTSIAPSTKHRPSVLRREIMRSPQETEATAAMDLFPHTKARMLDVPFRTPHYGNITRTAEILRREMLSIVFGWNDDVEALIRDELSRHRPGSASGVLLAKWLGDVGADSMASMVGSESMTSSDWMLLALSSIREDSQKKVGEAFVQRLLEKGDIHPAVAILLGLGEQNDAIEVYVSQAYWMEALLLCSLTSPSDWGRQSFLLRKWGEVSVQQGQPELAVRIFSCASVESSEAWFSPRAQDAIYTAQQQKLTDPSSGGPLASPPLSPPSASSSGRLAAKNASLKLITTFGDRGAPINNKDDPTPMAIGFTPIAESAISAHPGNTWQRQLPRRDNSEVRTATPGGYQRRKRLPSRTDIARAKAEAAEIGTPMTASRDTGSRAPSTSRKMSSLRSPTTTESLEEPLTSIKPAKLDTARLAPATRRDETARSPAEGAFSGLRADTFNRSPSRERKGSNLAVQVVETRLDEDALSPGPTTHDTGFTSITVQSSRAGAMSPPLSAVSMKNNKSKAIDDYISSVEQARVAARQERAESRKRAPSRTESRTRATSRARERSESRKRDVKYIKPPKKSPASPVPMSPEEIAWATAKDEPPATTDDEDFYRVTSPVESNRSGRRQRSLDRSRLLPSQVDNARGRSDLRSTGSAARSPSSPLPLVNDQSTAGMRDPDTESDGKRVRIRAASTARSERQDLQARRAASRSRTASTTRKGSGTQEDVADVIADRALTGDGLTDTAAAAERRAKHRTKEEAARELEERRKSLARRPSAPPIPQPGDFNRPSMSPRSHTELGDAPHSYMPPISRSHTVDPDALTRYGKVTGTSTVSTPIGLPATPRAMRHPKYMTADPEKDEAPPVPEIPENLSSFSGSALSQVTGSNLSQAYAGSSLGQTAGSSLSQAAGSSLSQAAPSSLSQISSSLTSEQGKDGSEVDSIGPLLPSTVYGMKGPQAPRSASVPVEKMSFGGLPSHPAFNADLPRSNRRLSKGHIRKISPPDHPAPAPNTDAITSIDGTISATNDTGNDQDIIIIPAEDEPVILPQLQHLAGPPPPPPAPTMFSQVSTNSGVINIAIDGTESNLGSDLSSQLSSAPSQFPQPMDRANTTSPSSHRRGRGSIGGNETFTSRMRGVAERMRSSSRAGNAKSPVADGPRPMPYETVLPPIAMNQQRTDGWTRAKSPYEQAMAGSQRPNDQIPPPPPPPPAPQSGMDAKLNEYSIPPRSQSAVNGYRNPKEIRANMPPDYTQAGVQGGFL